jgi:hypothetical protein
MQALSSQSGDIAYSVTSTGCWEVLKALLEEQDKLLSGHVPAVLQGYRFKSRWGCSDHWLDFTWRLRQSVRALFC